MGEGEKENNLLKHFLFHGKPAFSTSPGEGWPKAGVCPSSGRQMSSHLLTTNNSHSKLWGTLVR